MVELKLIVIVDHHNLELLCSVYTVQCTDTSDTIFKNKKLKYDKGNIQNIFE